jgi:hypothetical protein
MKKILLLVIAIVISNLIMAQTSPINPERAVVGSDENTLPTSYADQNAALVVWKDGTLEPYEGRYPMLRVKHKDYAINLGMATTAGAMGGIDEGNAVLLFEGRNRMLFHLNSTDEYNTVKFQFGTSQTAFKTLVVSNSDRVGIGTDNFPNSFPNPDPASPSGGDNYRLYVKGGIKAEEVKVELCYGWCDYVFAKDYKLTSIKKLKTYIKTNKHLPNMPSAQMLANNGGFELGKMVTQQQEKIEENTLYIIQLNDAMEQLKKENKLLKKRLLAIEQKLAK